MGVTGRSRGGEKQKKMNMKRKGDNTIGRSRGGEKQKEMEMKRRGGNR